MVSQTVGRFCRLAGHLTTANFMLNRHISVSVLSTTGYQVSVINFIIENVLGPEIFIGSEKSLDSTDQQWRCQNIPFLEIESAYIILVKLFNKPSFPTQKNPSNQTFIHFL